MDGRNRDGQPLIIRFDELDSTSNYLKARGGDALPQFTVVVAANQSAGRGQRGNSWESAPGENLLMSMLFYPPEWLTPDRQFLISQCVALAVADTFDELLAGCQHPPVTVKWPNDIYIGDKKACGILIENTLSTSTSSCVRIERTVIGIGMNINQRIFTSPAPNPTSAIHYTDTPIPLDRALDLLVSNLTSRLTELLDAGNITCANSQMVGHHPRRAAFSTNGETGFGPADELEKLCSGISLEYHSRLWRANGTYKWLVMKGSLAPVPPLHTAATLPADPEIIEASIHSVSPSGPITLHLTSGTLRTFAFKEISPLL